jgi:iron-sulfur cluster assembly protein
LFVIDGKTALLTVTKEAQKQIAIFLEGKRTRSIRIMKTDACPGPKLELGLDEVADEDSVFEIAGVTYILDKNLLAQAQTIDIDFTDHGFDISSSLELGPQCSGCGTPNSRCGH